MTLASETGQSGNAPPNIESGISMVQASTSVPHDTYQRLYTLYRLDRGTHARILEELKARREAAASMASTNPG